MKKRKIVVVEIANSGGLIHFDYQMCTALANAGLDVTLLTGSDYELQFLPHNFSVVNILKLWKNFEEYSVNTEKIFIKRISRLIYRNFRRILRGLRAIWAWATITSYILNIKPEIVQFSRLEYPFEFFFILFLKKKGFKLSQVCHEFEERESKGVFSSLLHRFDLYAYRTFSAIFFLAEESRERFLSSFTGVSKNNTFVIPHGNSGWLLNIQTPFEDLKLRDRYKLRSNDKVVLFFGLISPSKGVEDLIEAFKLVLDYCDAKLVLAGYPTKHMNMNTIISSFSSEFSENVRTDFRYIPLSEIGALMDIASVVVYPYLSGTQSGALQVAYTFGKPVIATRVGGLPEVVDDTKSGFLVPPNSPYDLAMKIVVILKDDALANEMGKYAHNLSVTRFNWEEVVKKMLLIYSEQIFHLFN